MGNSSPVQNASNIQNRKLASAALVKPHAALRQFASLPDAIPSQPRGMALIDKIDEALATDKLEAAKEKLFATENAETKSEVDTAQMQCSLVRERIEQRVSAVPNYDNFVVEINELMATIKQAVQQYGLSDRENVPFYRLLREQIIKKT